MDQNCLSIDIIFLKLILIGSLFHHSWVVHEINFSSNWLLGKLLSPNEQLSLSFIQFSHNLSSHFTYLYQLHFIFFISQLPFHHFLLIPFSHLLFHPLSDLHFISLSQCSLFFFFQQQIILLSLQSLLISNLSWFHLTFSFTQITWHWVFHFFLSSQWWRWQFIFSHIPLTNGLFHTWKVLI